MLNATNRQSDFASLIQNYIHADATAGRKADRGATDWQEFAEKRDLALHAVTTALPEEFARLAGLAETGPQLVAELLLALFPSLVPAEEGKLSLSPVEPFTGLTADTQSPDLITARTGKILDDIANDFDEIASTANLSADAKKTVEEARSVLKDPTQWPTVWLLVEAVRG